MNDDVVAELAARYAGPAASARYDEAVTQLEHALQCAALAQRDEAPDALVAAALLHDVGHLLVGHDAAADRAHEAAGARYLRAAFGPDVTAPVALHVDAKRYLCATDAGYEASLSTASRRSLAQQGGPMSAEEARRFEARPGWADAVRLRRWDDLAKVPGAPTPTFDDLRPVLERLRHP